MTSVHPQVVPVIPVAPVNEDNLQLSPLTGDDLRLASSSLSFPDTAGDLRLSPSCLHCPQILSLFGPILGGETFTR